MYVEVEPLKPKGNAEFSLFGASCASKENLHKTTMAGCSVSWGDATPACNGEATRKPKTRKCDLPKNPFCWRNVHRAIPAALILIYDVCEKVLTPCCRLTTSSHKCRWVWSTMTAVFNEFRDAVEAFRFAGLPQRFLVPISTLYLPSLTYEMLSKQFSHRLAFYQRVSFEWFLSTQTFRNASRITLNCFYLAHVAQFPMRLKPWKCKVTNFFYGNVEL